MAGQIQPLQQQSLSPAPASDPPTAAAPITPDRKSEVQRAYREARVAIALLQQRWPAAFPETPQQIRPLITGLTPLVAAALDWATPTPALCCARGSCAPPIVTPSSHIPSALTWTVTQPTSRSTRTPAPGQRSASPPGPAGAGPHCMNRLAGGAAQHKLLIIGRRSHHQGGGAGLVGFIEPHL